MPASQLPITGKCYYCGEVCKNRYCNDNCRNMYNYRKEHPVQWQKQTKKSNREGTGYQPIGGTLEDRINRVVAKAIQSGDCYNVATLAPQ